MDSNLVCSVLVLTFQVPMGALHALEENADQN